jgi:hypothetical protein
MTRNRGYVALFGAVAMRREYCWRCRGMALVIDGELQCCDSPVSERPICGVKREIESEGVRRKPSTEAQAEILEHQENRCLYCEQEFGAWVFRNGKTRPVQLRVEWDHLVPFSYTASCHDDGFVAACHVCNGIKSATMFQGLDEARAHIALKRSDKGWSF